MTSFCSADNLFFHRRVDHTDDTNWSRCSQTIISKLQRDPVWIEFVKGLLPLPYDSWCKRPQLEPLPNCQLVQQAILTIASSTYSYLCTIVVFIARHIDNCNSALYIAIYIFSFWIYSNLRCTIVVLSTHHIDNCAQQAIIKTYVHYCSLDRTPYWQLVPTSIRATSWLPYSTYLYLDFHDKAKRIGQENLPLFTAPSCSRIISNRIGRLNMKFGGREGWH